MSYRTWAEMEEDLGPELTNTIKGQQAYAERLVAQAEQRTSRRAMMAALDAAVPNWREINENENFIRMLESVKHPGGGYSLLEDLKNDFAHGNVSSVIQYFRSFLDGRLAQMAAGGKPGVAADPFGNGGQANVDTRGHLAPGRNNGPMAGYAMARVKHDAYTNSAGKDLGMIAAKFGFNSEAYRAAHRQVYGVDPPSRYQIGLAPGRK